MIDLVRQDSEQRNTAGPRIQFKIAQSPRDAQLQRTVLDEMFVRANSHRSPLVTTLHINETRDDVQRRILCTAGSPRIRRSHLQA